MSRIICLCNRVGGNDVEKVLSKHPQASIKDVMNLTAASTSCGRCRSELEAFIEEIKSKQPATAPSSQLTIPFDFS
ncbi:(2Fe-2S)-binding protein [Marinilabilia rubra]|nr:(2Fe-2S)-binding protein [Marinilabilia rubra]